MTTSTTSRTWDLWAHRYASGKLHNIGARPWVELHQLKDPIVAVLVEEILGDLYAADVTHYAWEDHKHPSDKPAMVQVRAGSDPSCALMLLDMCFPYGIKGEIKAGSGRVLALRITERVVAPDSTEGARR